MLHRGSTSPAAEVFGKIPAFKTKGKTIVDEMVDVKSR